MNLMWRTLRRNNYVFLTGGSFLLLFSQRSKIWDSSACFFFELFFSPFVCFCGSIHSFILLRLRFVFQPSSFDVRANGDQMWKKKEEESLWDYEKTWKKGTFKVKIFTKKIHFFLRKHPILLSFSRFYHALSSFLITEKKKKKKTKTI